MHTTKQQFDQHGYAVIENFVSDQECDLLRTHMNAQLDELDISQLSTIFSTHNQAHAQHNYFLDSGDKIHYFFEEGAFDEDGHLRVAKALSINKVGHALHTKDEVFSRFSNSENLHTLMQTVGLEQPLIMQSMYIFKQPKIGGEVIPHQDSTYLYIHEQPITGFWFALEDATIENGCLWAIPGGHQTPLKSRMKRHADDQISTEVYDESPWEMDKMVPLEVKKGSVIVLHGLLPHMSKTNHSDKSRHAYAVHAMSGQHTFDKENWIRLPTERVADGEISS